MIYLRVLPYRFIILVLLTASFVSSSCDQNRGKGNGERTLPDNETTEKEYPAEYVFLVSPEIPRPGENFRIITTGGFDIGKAKISVTGPEGEIASFRHKTTGSFPYWRVDEYRAGTTGTYKVTWKADNRETQSMEFAVSPMKPGKEKASKTAKGWDPGMETLYSAWINALFAGDGEEASWTSLNAVTERPDKNFLFNHFGLNEDDASNNPDSYRGKVIMQPDCADNPFFLRAYFAWKLGLPFGFHICDRGGLDRSPATGAWVTSESPAESANPVLAFNGFLRKVMNGIHSGTARTAFDNDRSDYYPVPLEKTALRPGVVFADPYGHTLIIVGWIPQDSNAPGKLLAVDAQPDGTIGIKRFWKGNFLFTTRDVVGEPGFKAFRPVLMKKGVPVLLRNNELNTSSGFIPFSLQQRKMESDVFYHTIERLINPKPLDPEDALKDLIKALHEQLLVRVTSVANGEEYMKSHPGTVIPMPSNASGLFQAGGQWENFSTPNRDLRLLIAMDAVLGFPDKVAQSPRDFKISGMTSPEKIKKELQTLLDQMVSDQFITYTRTDGSSQKLTLRTLLDRKEAFEIAWNPNDGIEIRWGAPEKSDERATCKRYAPPSQHEKMLSFRNWFQKRLHPPT